MDGRAGGYDAVLLVSFGGPEGPDDVVPFLRRVTAGRDIPAERLAQVAATYERFGGVSPLNGANRALVAALRNLLEREGPALPVYWGNRNWQPLLEDTVATMAADGVRRAVALVTSAYASYSSCRQYLEDIARARAAVGPGAPVIDKIRPFYNHPLFVASLTRATAAALHQLPPDRRAGARLLFTAHSIPTAMAEACEYEAQLLETSRLVASGVPGAPTWRLVFQSRSGPPSVPWLEPDVSAALVEEASAGTAAVVLAPIGFVSDHMEVVYDLDVVATELARELGLDVARAATPGTDPDFAAMARELVLELVEPGSGRRALGDRGPRFDLCGAGCCPAPRRRESAPGGT